MVVQESRRPRPVRHMIPLCNQCDMNKDVGFRVLSYNILADTYAKKSNGCCWPDWELRKNLLLNEILNHKPDIICLQEVEWDFKEFIGKHLERQGFAVYYKPKIQTGYGSIEGCLTAFHSAWFELVDVHEIEFDGLAKKTFQDPSEIKHYSRASKMSHHKNKGKGPKLDLKLNLSLLPRGEPSRVMKMEPDDEDDNDDDSPTRMSTSSSSGESLASPPSSCMSLENSPQATKSMVLAGCPRCLMYMMLSEDEEPKCPKCHNAVLLDFNGGSTKNSNGK